MTCRPLREGVGRNRTLKKHEIIVDVALYARAWVEIDGDYTWAKAEEVALYARAWVEIGPGRASRRPRKSPATPRGGVEFAAAFAFAESDRPSPSTRGRG